VQFLDRQMLKLGIDQGRVVANLHLTPKNCKIECIGSSEQAFLEVQAANSWVNSPGSQVSAIIRGPWSQLTESSAYSEAGSRPWLFTAGVEGHCPVLMFMTHSLKRTPAGEV
jgi:hypothetical protein